MTASATPTAPARIHAGLRGPARRRRRRLVVIVICGAVLAVALALVLHAMRDTIVFFRSPSEVAAGKVSAGTRIRLGGLVETGSLKREPDQRITFSVTDTGASVPVRYQGLLPDLFREGQGVVAEGVIEPGGGFRADTVLAKHDEAYMPREVADALKAQGRWQEGAGGAPAKAGAAGTEPRR